MLDATSPALAEVVERILDASHPGAGAAAVPGRAPPGRRHRRGRARRRPRRGLRPRPPGQEPARHHRLADPVGAQAGRRRRARPIACATSSATSPRCTRSGPSTCARCRAPGPTVEIVPAAPLVQEVVAAAAARGTAPIDAQIAAGLPELRGDHVLLREALLNVVVERGRGVRGDRRPGHGHGARGRPGRRSGHRDRRRRHRHRHPAGRARPHLRARLHDQGDRLRRRPDHRRAGGRRPPRPHPGRQRGGQGYGGDRAACRATSAASPASAAWPRSRRARERRGGGTTLSGTIVCVDDQAEVRRLLGEVFRARGRDVASFDDGEDAIRWLDDRRGRDGRPRPRPRRRQAHRHRDLRARSAAATRTCRSSS